MRLLHAELEGFRNFECAVVDPGAGLTALVGANGQGKTNALEALYLLSALRPLRPGDGSALAAISNHRATVEAIPFLNYPFTRQAAYALIARNEGGQERFYGLFRKADQGLIGVAGAHLRGDEAVELGYWLDPRYHGQGFATEAASALARALARHLPQRAIIAECRPENAASWRVLIKSGFDSDGRPGSRPGRLLLTWSGQS